jgi:hypothetical protein
MPSAPVAPAWFRYLSWSFALLLLLCAGLQFNDPDPVRWIAIYAGAVVVGMGAAIWCGYLAAPVVGLVSFSDLFTTMSEKSGLVERAREAIGTGLVSLWLASAATIAKRIVKRGTTAGAKPADNPTTPSASATTNDAAE